MAIKFDGKAYSDKVLNNLKSTSFDKTPKLASILVGDDSASLKYSQMKKTAADSIGFSMQIKKFDEDSKFAEIEYYIQKLNEDKDINGIMIQLPLPKSLSNKTSDLINQIDKKKDVDGLLNDSPFVSATVKAVLKTLDFAKRQTKLNIKSIAIIGSKGEVGSRLISNLSDYQLLKLDINDDLEKIKSADVVISATGVESLIKPEYLKNNVIIIDVGAPKPEFDKSCYEKSSFYTPVPGGIGPMTIACLMENLLNASKKS